MEDQIQKSYNLWIFQDMAKNIADLKIDKSHPPMDIEGKYQDDSPHYKKKSHAQMQYKRMFGGRNSQDSLLKVPRMCL